MTVQSMEGRLCYLVAGRAPVVLVVAESEERVEAALRACLPSLPQGAALYTWTVTEGLRTGDAVVQGTTGVAEAVNAALKLRGPAVFFFKDLHLLLGRTPDPWLIRRLKDVAAAFPGRANALVFRSATIALPEDLVPTVTVLEDTPPTRAELSSLLKTWGASAPAGEKLPTQDFAERFLHAAAGLPLYEVSRTLGRFRRRSPGDEDRLLRELTDEKARLVNRSGVLEYVEADVAIEQLGGMQSFKTWLEERRHVFTDTAQRAGVLPPRGVLLMGITGCGKSIAVKAAANFFNLPLVRLDMVRLYGGGLGAPEESIRRATGWAESLAPCLLWMDEMEAGITVAGHKAEGGPASRILGYFLTWMQERRAPVFVGATANAIDLLPAEVLRKGRFDEIFYVSLPGKAERLEIFRLHLRRRGVDPDGLDLDLAAHGTKGYSGSEIEQVVASALVAAQFQNRQITATDLAGAVSRTVPMSVTMAEQIKRIESWAFRRAVRASTKAED